MNDSQNDDSLSLNSKKGSIISKDQMAILIFQLFGFWNDRAALGKAFQGGDLSLYFG